ncbi:MAG: hypothetical protein DRQ49_02270 [Gammaproteobacteria bacterium]|nr:MAG: hypothetical protein DRQ41_15890 [Gammaproteobacteria bacterium]RKZ42356.1 MAG: hypothetical protein DRQ49_02270 [Gammaproteobacteria bacterium]RKZ77229.1 MAG: hypothetical protein DRQ57_00620 [Gammaproteobacteria bacterium]
MIKLGQLGRLKRVCTWNAPKPPLSGKVKAIRFVKFWKPDRSLDQNLYLNSYIVNKLFTTFVEKGAQNINNNRS